MIKVLIVDDSPVVGRQMKHILELEGNMCVVGMVVNGEEAVAFAQKRRPDVIAIDSGIQRMGVYEATRRIMETCPVPVVIMVEGYQCGDVEKSFNALDAGAVAVVEKPFDAMGNSNDAEAVENFIAMVRLMSEIKVVRRWNGKRRVRESPVPLPEAERKVTVVAIGASTGGPPALQSIFSCLKKDFPVPLLVVQHITKNFLEGMIEWLGKTTVLPIQIATHGGYLLPGHIYFAPDNFHLGVGSDGRMALSNDAPENYVRPSVSYLFRSVNQVYGKGAIGVLLTGMGRDGAYEMGMMKRNGAVTITQDKESCVIYGMPCEAVKLGAATHVLPLEKIPVMLEELVKEKETE